MSTERTIVRKPDSSIEVTEPDGVQRRYSQGDEIFITRLNGCHTHPDGSRVIFHPRMPNPGVDMLSYYPGPEENSPYKRIFMPLTTRKASYDGVPIKVMADYNPRRSTPQRGGSLYDNFIHHDEEEPLAPDSPLFKIFSDGIKKLGFSLAELPRYEDDTPRRFTFATRPPEDQQFLEQCELVERAKWGSQGYPQYFRQLAETLQRLTSEINQATQTIGKDLDIIQLRETRNLMRQHGMNMEENLRMTRQGIEATREKIPALETAITQLTARLEALKSKEKFSEQPRNQPGGTQTNRQR